MTFKKSPGWSSAAVSLLGPILIGISMYLLIELLISRHAISDETLLRYLIGHPISRITVAMFCVGLASLLMIANNVFDQYCEIDQITLGDGDFQSPTVDSSAVPLASLAEQKLLELDQLKRRFKRYYLWHRLRNVLEYVLRCGGAMGVDGELKYLADLDLDRQQQRYSLVRIVIWATPMLGFLGTVLGISQALGSIQVGPDNDFGQMMNGMRSSLYVAFDTTALALTLSIGLMFIQFLTDRFEAQLLDVVDQRAQREISKMIGDVALRDSKTEVVAEFGRSVIAASEEFVRRQIVLWQDLINKLESVSNCQNILTGNLDALYATSRLQETLDRLNVAIARLAPESKESPPVATLRMRRRADNPPNPQRDIRQPGLKANANAA